VSTVLKMNGPIGTWVENAEAPPSDDELIDQQRARIHELEQRVAQLLTENGAMILTLARLGARCEYAVNQVTELQTAATSAVNERRENDLTQQVTKFALAFGYPVRTRITEPTADEVALRLQLITEEFLELLEAHGAPGLIRSEIWERVTKWVEWQRGGPGFRVDIVKAADALADMDFVNEGHRLTMGIPRQAVANEVSRSNLAKVGGEHDTNGKLQKPPGWTPPDIDGVLARYR